MWCAGALFNKIQFGEKGKTTTISTQCLIPCAFFTETLPRPWTWEAGFLLTCSLVRSRMRARLCGCVCVMLCICYTYLFNRVSLSSTLNVDASFLSLGAGWKTGIRTSVADVDCYHSPKCILSVVRLRRKNYQLYKHTKWRKKSPKILRNAHTHTHTTKTKGSIADFFSIVFSCNLKKTKSTIKQTKKCSCRLKFMVFV